MSNINNSVESFLDYRLQPQGLQYQTVYCYACGTTYYSHAGHICTGFKQYAALTDLDIGAKPMDGTKITVICAGSYEQFDTIEKAQAKAEELAHARSADAFILKPIKKVSPKRDVVTTDL